MSSTHSHHIPNTTTSSFPTQIRNRSAMRTRINRIVGDSLLSLRLFPVRMGAVLANRAGEKAYDLVDEKALRARKKSDTVFILGSGYSINDIPAAEWERFKEHDTISFNWFIHQDLIPVDYHLVREIAPNDLDQKVWRPKIQEYGDLIKKNRHYAKTIFLVQGGWPATNGNRLVGHRLLPDGAKVFRFHNVSRGVIRPPTQSFAEGLAHSAGTLADCVNFASIMGWTRIVLVGVDLYDRRYFWLDRDEAALVDRLRNARPDQPHNMATSTLECLDQWNKILRARGIEMMVYNPRSLLSRVLPIFNSGVA